MAVHSVERLRQAHRKVAESAFEVVQIRKGYADRVLRVDLTTNQISLLPVTQQMKDLWVGGKGFDLWLMFQEVTRETRWNSPENPICMSPGPLAGTTSFPGSGKTLVTSLSPSTGSVMDCNVGGFFGPLFKFTGLDALVVVGKAPEETIVVIDAVEGRITIERAPLESIDGHLAAEEFTEMYAADDLDKKNISVVCSGRGAQHTRMGVLNFSFYDWRKRTARIKQAGRGGIGTVFRDKKLKAIVVRNRGINPAWSVTESKVARLVEPRTVPELSDAESRATIQAVLARWNESADHVIDMLAAIQAHFGYLPRAALIEVTRATKVPTAYLYHIATFMDGFHLEPRGRTVVEVCTGPACRVLGAEAVLAAFEQLLGVKAGATTGDGGCTLLAGACLGACSAAPAVRVGGEIYGEVQPSDAAELLRRHGVTVNGTTTPLRARALTDAEQAAVAAEKAAALARARALLAICTGRRTPVGEAGKADKATEGTAKGDPTQTMLAGRVQHPGPVTVKPGTTLRALIEQQGGGVRDGVAFKAAQVGGPSGPILTADRLDEVLDLAALTPRGALSGPERLLVVGETDCMVETVRHLAAVLMHQSCGKCTPCREGLHAAVQLLDRLRGGRGGREDLARLAAIIDAAQAASACQFGVSAVQPLRTALSACREEFEEHARGRCRAGVCTGLGR